MMSNPRHTHRSLLSALLSCVALAAPAAAQVQPVCSESFDYASPGLLMAQNGASGWVGAWWVSGAVNDDIVIFDQTVTPSLTIADPVGNYAGVQADFATAFRTPNLSLHSDITDINGMFGLDNTTMWFSFSTVTYQSGGDHYAGFSLWEAGVGEIFFIGSPWASYSYGVDDQHIGGPGAALIAGSDDSQEARLVTRIDFLPGQERVRMWIDPSVPHPVSPAPLDMLVPDFRWNEIRISSGGSNSFAYWDDLRIEKGAPSSNIGINICGPAIANSSGLSGVIEAQGSLLVADNNVTLSATALPNNQFGLFLNSLTAGFVPNPGGSQGNLCLSGGIGRYNPQAGYPVQNTGTNGSLAIALDLTTTPTPTGSAAISAGQTWVFQCWYRDLNPGAVSNFTDAVSVTFQ